MTQHVLYGMPPEPHPLLSVLSGPLVQVSTAKGWRGGERQALGLAEGLYQKEMPVVLVAPPESPLLKRAQEIGIETFPLVYRGEWDLVAAWKLASFLRKKKAGLVHAHDGHAVMLAGLAGRLSSTPAVCTRRVDFPIRGAWKYRWWMKRVICISSAIRQICAQGGIPAERMPVVFSGIDVDAVKNAPGDNGQIRASFGEDAKKERRLVVLNVASLTDHKGQTYLLDAMPRVLKQVPNALFLIAGDGELEAPLKAQAKELALDEDVLQFLGFREDVLSLLKACDLFVMSSHLEGLCTSVMDAMAAGKAVVATRAGGIPEVVHENETGLLVPVRDPDALADALISLLQDRKLRERYGRSAAVVARMQFGFDKMVEGTLEVYRQLLLPD